MKFYATGSTAESLRARAGNRVVVRALAAAAMVSPDAMRDTVLGLADGIDAITAEGLTREQCYFLAHLDETLGPWPGDLSA
jgi:hypothetical protein